MEPKKVLLVSSESEEKIIACLRRDNFDVIKADDAASALTLAKHVAFDVVVLISTGDAMTRTEAALNLRDIRPSSEIILVARDRAKLSEAETAAREISHTHVLSRQELQSFLARTET